MKNQTQEKIITHRVITMLNRQEMEFLDKVGKDALFTTGHKLSYNDILKALIDLAMEMRLSGENIDSLAALKEKILTNFQDRVLKPVGGKEVRKNSKTGS